MFDQSEFVKAGKIGKPHGVSGETAVRLLPEMERFNLVPSFVFININEGLVPFRVKDFRYKTDEVLLVKLPLLNTQEKIRTLVNCEVFVWPQEAQPLVNDSDEQTSLIGYEVRDVNLGFVGIIEGVQEISGNPLFIVKSEKGEVLIPATDDFVVELDDLAKQITVDTPDGLLQINEE